MNGLKILMIIDNLGSGGAERQCVALAIALKSRGHEVHILGYALGDHFLDDVDAAGISYRLILEANPLIRTLKFRRLIRREAPGAVIAFLSTGAALAELASPLSRKWKLVVSERNNVYIRPSCKSRIHLRLHRLADYVTTNSHDTREAILKLAPRLEGKLLTIYNGLDLDRFSPRDRQRAGGRKRLVVISSHQEHKNARNLIRAMRTLKERARFPMPVVYWYGSDVSDYTGRASSAYLEARELIRESGLQRDFILEPPVNEIERIYRDADAVILPSYREGLPNAICEGMACGLPVLMGRVSDYQVLTEGNGIAFDPYSVDSITEALEWFLGLEEGELAAMKRRSREKSMELFDPEHFADAYETLILN
jgi:glycosyltransferase involved in cell wall biosynthesis